MTIERTKNELVEMHLSAMKPAFEQQLEDRAMQKLSFEDRFSNLSTLNMQTGRATYSKEW